MSRTKASFSHVPFSDFEGRLARKPRFHICHFQILRASRTKASFSHLPLSDFEGCLARKLHFHMCHFQFVWGKSRAKASFSHLPLSDSEGRLARNSFLRDSRCAKYCVSEDGWGSLSGGRLRDGLGYMFGSWSERPRSGTDSSGVFLLTFLRLYSST